MCVQRRYRDVSGVAVSLVADEDEGERRRVVDARALDELRVPHADLLERRLQLDCVCAGECDVRECCVWCPMCVVWCAICIVCVVCCVLCSECVV